MYALSFYGKSRKRWEQIVIIFQLTLPLRNKNLGYKMFIFLPSSFHWSCSFHFPFFILFSFNTLGWPVFYSLFSPVVPSPYFSWRIFYFCYKSRRSHVSLKDLMFDLCVRANKESFSLQLKFKSSVPIKTNWQHSQSSMGCNVLNRKLIYLGCDQKSWSSSMLFDIVGIIWKAKMPQLPKKKKKKTTNIYRLLTKLEAATSYISY